MDIAKINKLRDSLNKKGIATEISNPDCWISTGSYALNFIMTGNFQCGIPNRRSTLFWGESGTGKSYLMALAALEAQKKGYYVVWMDTEEAMNDSYLEKIGMDLSLQHFLPQRFFSLEDAYTTMANNFKTFDGEKVCYVFDSISNMETAKGMADFEKGDLKGDQGQQAKQIKRFMKNVNQKVGQQDAFFLCSAHAYQNQDLLNGEGKWILSGGKGFQFLPSISVMLQKAKLKDEANKSKILGVKIKPEITKSRFTQLGGKTEIFVPWTTGIDPNSGLLELAEDAGLIYQASKTQKAYKDADGNEVKFFGKNFNEHITNLFDFDVGDTPEEVDEGVGEEVEGVGEEVDG